MAGAGGFCLLGLLLEKEGSCCVISGAPCCFPDSGQKEEGFLGNVECEPPPKNGECRLVLEAAGSMSSLKIVEQYVQYWYTAPSRRWK